jgi:hypothetical protein
MTLNTALEQNVATSARISWTLEALVTTPRNQLDELFRGSPAGAMPAGDSLGVYLGLVFWGRSKRPMLRFALDVNK